MTVNEFKAWLDGYLAAGGDDVGQIKEQLKKVSEAPLEWRVPTQLGGPTFTWNPNTSDAGPDLRMVTTC